MDLHAKKMEYHSRVVTCDFHNACMDGVGVKGIAHVECEMTNGMSLAIQKLVRVDDYRLRTLVTQKFCHKRSMNTSFLYFYSPCQVDFGNLFTSDGTKRNSSKH